MCAAFVVFIILASSLKAASADVGNSTVDCKVADSCEKCVQSTACYWCENVQQCFDYKLNHMSTYFEHCKWNEARWQYCWLNVMALVITCSVIAGILLIAFIVLCCWCNSKCRKRRLNKMDQEEAELQVKEEERRIKSDEKNAERKTRNDQLRTKYGLLKEEHGE